MNTDDVFGSINEASDAQDLQLVVFRLGAEDYGLPIIKVQEINCLVPITKIPSTPKYMEGIINLRGHIIPVIDFRKRMQLTVNEYTDDTRIIVVEVGGRAAGMIVDEVREVLTLTADVVEPPPETIALEEKYVRGVGKYEGRLIILLDIDAILGSQEETSLKEAHG